MGNSGDMVIKVKDIEQIRSHNAFKVLGSSTIES